MNDDQNIMSTCRQRKILFIDNVVEYLSKEKFGVAVDSVYEKRIIDLQSICRGMPLDSDEFDARRIPNVEII
jgi:homospermidine synthase